MTNPLSPAQWQRLRELRDGSELTPAQNAELEQLLAQADAHEATILEPRNRILEEETSALKKQNQQLAILVERRRQLVARLAATLETARTEQNAIDRELRQLLPSEEAAALLGASR